MDRSQKFWTGNSVNPVAEHYRRVIEDNRQKEAELVAHEAVLAAHGPEFAAKQGLRFLGTRRRYPEGTRIEKDPRLSWMTPPKSVIELGFEVAPAGTAGWRVRGKLAPWVQLSGKQSSGWIIWLEEKDIARLSEIWRKPDIPPVEERSVPQPNGTLTNFGGVFRECGYSNNKEYFVIATDGILRNPDITTKDEKLWKVVAGTDLALYHAKSFQHAEHVFEVRHLPVGGLTEAQKETVNRLQEVIAEKWEGRVTGNHNLSPSMGDGWGLTVPTYRRIGNL
ncbi:MAG: hypothetical protein WCT08_02625 [Patescibacteria group bacterium]|jgi:hypothetical protein